MASQEEIPATRVLSTERQTRESLSLTLSTREDKEVVQAVDAAAMASGITRSKYISQAVHRALIEPNEDSFRKLDSRIAEAMRDSTGKIERTLERMSSGLKISDDMRREGFAQLLQEIEAALHRRDRSLSEYFLIELHNESIEQRKSFMQTSVLIAIGMLVFSVASAYLIQQLLSFRY